MSIDLSILIPTHNRCGILSRTLDSLSELRVDGRSIEVLVVANACTDQTAQVVAEKAELLPFPVRCISEPEPGLSRARNCAIEHARSDILAFLDDDVWVEEGWLVALLDTYASQPEAAIVGGRVDLWWDEVQPPAWMTGRMVRLLSGTHLNSDREVELDGPLGLIGANFSFRRCVYEQIGGFRTDLGRTGQGLGSAEEREYFARALAKGFRIFYTPFAGLKHWVAPDRVDIKYLDAVARGNARSRVLMKKTFGAGQAFHTIAGHLYLILRHTPAELLHASRGDRRKQYDHSILRMAGIGGLTGVWQRLTKGPES